MEVKQLVGWNIRRVRQERGLTIEALAHQAHVSAAWLGEEFKNGQAPAVSAAGAVALEEPARTAAWKTIASTSGSRSTVVRFGIFAIGIQT